MAETLREFLVGIGYKVDGASEDKFKRSVETATKAVNAMALSLVAATAAVSAAITKIASNFDDLYWTSQRTKASAENIKALGYAVSQLGGSYRGAVSSIEEFARRMRSNPGYEAMARNLGVVTRENGKLRDTTAIMTDLAKVLSKKPQYVALQYLEALGIDEQTYNALKSGDLVRYTEEYRKKQQALGVDQSRAAEIGKELTNAWRALGATAQTVGEKLMQELGPGLKDFVERVDAFLMRNSDRIVEFFKKAAELVGKLMDAFVQLVEKGEGPIVAMFDKIMKSVDTLEKVLVAFAAFLVGSWVLSILGAFTRVGAGWAALLLRFGINPATIAVGVPVAGAIASGSETQKSLESGDYQVDPNTGGLVRVPKGQGYKEPEQGKDTGGGWGALGRMWKRRPKWMGGTGGADGMSDGRIQGLSERGQEDYANRLGFQESRNNYAQPGNKFGFRGRWQMGGPALADAGYVRKGTSNRGLANPSNWLGKDGLNSLEDFLANKDGGQDKAFAAFTSINYARLKKMGVIKDGMSEEEVAGWLAVAHLKGPGGALQLSRGRDNYDANGTSASSYYRMMRNLRTGSKGIPAGAPSPYTLGGILGAGPNVPTLERVLGNAATMGSGAGAAPASPLMPGPTTNSSTNVELNQKTEVTILGGGDPQATASAVSDAQNGVNGRLLRNMQGAVR